MANLGKEKTIEQIKAELASLSPEQKAERLKKAKEKQEKNKQTVFEDKNSFTDIKKLVIEDDFDYEKNKNLYDLTKVTEFEKKAIFENTDHQLKTLPALKKIGGNACFSFSKLQSMPELTTINGDAEFSCSEIENLPKLKTINGSARFDKTIIPSMPQLQTIGGNAEFGECLIQSLPNLTSIGGNAYFNNTKLKALPKLKLIKQYAFIEPGTISLPQLEEVGGSLTFLVGEIPQLPQLKKCPTIYLRVSPFNAESFTLKQFRLLENKLRNCKTMEQVKLLRAKYYAELIRNRS